VANIGEDAERVCSLSKWCDCFRFQSGSDIEIEIVDGVLWVEEHSCEKIGGRHHTTVVKWKDFCIITEAESGTGAEDQLWI